MFLQFSDERYLNMFCQLALIATNIQLSHASKPMFWQEANSLEEQWLIIG